VTILAKNLTVGLFVVARDRAKKTFPVVDSRGFLSLEWLINGPGTR